MSGKQIPSYKIGLYLFPEEGWMDGETARWKDIKAMAQSAEHVGFDAIWLPDRLTHVRDGQKRGVWESMTMLSAIAAVTSRVEIGQAVLRSIYRNPALLAKMVESIDEISGGRFILGLGSGSSTAPPKADNYAFGFPTDHAVSRFEEALQITLGLLRAGSVNLKGRFYEAHECTLQPRGPRPSGPPIFIAAMGPKMMRLAARYADIWGAPVPALTPATYEKYRVGLENACSEVGRDTSSIVKMAIVGIGAAAEGEAARNPYGDSLNGPPQKIAEALHAFVQAGYKHIMLSPYPNSLAAVERCAPILEALKRH